MQSFTIHHDRVLDNSAPGGIYESCVRKTKRIDDEHVMQKRGRAALENVTNRQPLASVHGNVYGLPSTISACSSNGNHLDDYQHSAQYLPLKQLPEPPLSAASTDSFRSSLSGGSHYYGVSSVVPSSQFNASMNITTPPLVHTSPGDASDLVKSVDLGQVDPADAFNSPFSYLLEAQKSRRPTPGYMETQADINPQMRGILVDWLVEVAEEYKLKMETLHLTVNFIDRFLAVSSVNRGKLQLVGVSCMLVAAKYEEIFAPHVDDFVYITDNTYSKYELLQMEVCVLERLKWECTAVTSNVFLHRLCCAMNIAERPRCLAQFLIELALPEYSMIATLPSLVATAALSIALFNENGTAWSQTLQLISRHTPEEIRSTAVELHRLLLQSNMSGLQAIREKYSHSKFQRVSMMTPRADYSI